MMDLTSARPKSRVAVAGLGSIGARVVQKLDRGIEGLVLSAVSAQSIAKHRGWLDKLKTRPEVLPTSNWPTLPTLSSNAHPASLSGRSLHP